jgi:hypothetical protein
MFKYWNIISVFNEVNVMERGSLVINSVCQETGYTRQHVSTMLRRFATEVGAERGENRQWRVRDVTSAIEKLTEIVLTASGPRCKLGEKKPPRK